MATKRATFMKLSATFQEIHLVTLPTVDKNLEKLMKKSIVCLFNYCALWFSFCNFNVASFSGGAQNFCFALSANLPCYGPA